VASFDTDEDPGLRLLVQTSVTRYHRTAVLQQAVDRLTRHGYQVVHLDASDWTSDADLHRDLAAALAFPTWYGHNLDALADCLDDVVNQRYGWPPRAAGLVLMFTRYDRFVAHRPRTAQVVLDLVAGQSRQAAVRGQRLICLLHTDDPAVSFPPVGASPVLWNDDEQNLASQSLRGTTEA
jgi:hypothetical protein